MVHKTRDGKVMLLAEMDNQHLLNTIHLKLDVLESAKEALGENVKRNKFDEALYGEAMSEDSAKDFVAFFDRNIAPYLAEALIRSMDISTAMDRYRTLLGRASRIKISVSQRRKLIAEYQSFGESPEEDYEE